MNDLENRILKLEKLIYEGKYVGDLYHVCTADAVANYIVPNNILKGSGKYINKLLNSTDIVSFTRNPNFVAGTSAIEEATVLFQFVVDGNKLSDKYRIMPYNDFYTRSGIISSKGFEAEEVVEGTIKNFKSYIKEAHFDLTDAFFNPFNDFEEDLKNLNIINEYLSGIKVTRSNLAAAIFKKKKDYGFKLKTLDDVIDFTKNALEMQDDARDFDLDELIHEYADSYKYRDPDKLMFSDNLDDVMLALKKGGNIEARDKVNRTPLIYAAGINKINIVKLLIKNGADLNAQDKQGRTALIVATKFKRHNIADILIKAGADTALTDNDGKLAADYV